MKAEERKHLKENELATRLGRFWETVASGSTTNTIIWGVILLGLVLAVGWRFYADASFRGRSALWSELSDASDNEKLRKIIKENPGTVTARVARYHLARSLLQESLGRIAGPSTDDKQKAAEMLEEARKLYAELARESGTEPLLTQEALMGVAKAEEILASVPKANNENDVRGSLDQAIKSYEELAKAYPESFLGKEAEKRAQELRDHKSQVAALYVALSREHGKPAPPPALPPLPTPPLPTPLGTVPALPEAPKAETPPAPVIPVPQPPAAPPAEAPKETPKPEPKGTPQPGEGQPKN